MYRLHLSLLLIITIIHSYAGHCQNPSNIGRFEVTAGYGPFNNLFLYEDYLTRHTIKNSGTLFVGLRYFVHKQLALSVYAGFSHQEGTLPDPYAPNGSFKRDFRTISAELFCIYYSRKRLDIYTLVGIGRGSSSIELTTYSYSLSSMHTFTESGGEGIMVYYSPLGIRYGGRLAGFLEVGLGYKGFVSGGISYKFAKPVPFPIKFSKNRSQVK